MNEVRLVLWAFGSHKWYWSSDKREVTQQDGSQSAGSQGVQGLGGDWWHKWWGRKIRKAIMDVGVVG
jgi:hypothetical protein